MPILRSLIKVGVAKRIYRAARKPENQRRAKELWAKATSNKGSRSR